MKIELTLAATIDLGPVDGVTYFPVDDKGKKVVDDDGKAHPQPKQSRIDEVVEEQKNVVVEALTQRGFTVTDHYFRVHVDEDVEKARS